MTQRLMHRRTALAALGLPASLLPVGGLLAGCAPLTSRTAASAPMVQTAEVIAVPGRRLPFRAWVALPAGYTESRERWPLVVFLHGSGERGDDLRQVLVHGPPRHAAAGRAYPFVLVSPQLEAGQRWNPQHLHRLLDAVAARWRVDRDRVCCTGLSLGGHGSWDWATAHPEDLAGIAPVCGYGDVINVCRGRTVPVRAYHGDADTVTPLPLQQACVDALRACGGTVSFTVYPGVGHDAWVPAYDDPGLVPWLMAQRLHMAAAAR
jgi:predicted peptidase